MICKNKDCRAELPDDAMFCLKCGEQQVVTKDNIYSAETISLDKEADEENSRRKSVKITLIAMAVICTIVLLLTIFSTFNDKNSNGKVSTNSNTKTQATNHDDTKSNYVSTFYKLEDCPIVVDSYYTSYPNSVDGVDLYIKWRSTDYKEIKYVYFSVTPYNRVDDEQYCEIRNRSTVNGQVTGPINYGDFETSQWDCAWYNGHIDHIELDKITIEYMDGTKRTYYK